MGGQNVGRVLEDMVPPFFGLKGEVAEVQATGKQRGSTTSNVCFAIDHFSFAFGTIHRVMRQAA